MIRIGSTLAAIAAAAVVATGLPAQAEGSWHPASSGSAAGYSKSRQLPAGLQPTAAVSGRNVAVSWTAPSGGAPPSGYLIQRYNLSGAAQTIGSSCSGVVTATSCTEQAVAPGSWTYSVTPANANWRGGESPLSATAVVGSPALTLNSLGVATLPATVTGQIVNYVANQTVVFRLDNATSGTLLVGSIAPTPVPAGGTSTVSVTLPAGTSVGTHTVFAVGSSGDTTSAPLTVLTPQTVTTTGWDLRDASAGAAEVNASDLIAYADGRTQATTAPTTAFAATRYLLVDYNAALPTNATPSSSTFDFRFASPASNTSCFYFDVRLASTDAVLATHGSTASPVGCVSNTTQTSFSTALPEVTTAARANDLRVRVYIRNSASAAPVVDQATVSTTTSQGAFTLYDKVFTDKVNAGTTDRTWPLVAAAGTTYTSASTWSTSFAAGRYLKLAFPTYVPTSATVTGASFTHRYRSSGGGSVCWYFEVLQGATVIGTHGSPAAPINCNASTSTYAQDAISLPEINSPAKANGAVIKVYMRNASTQRSQTDLAQLQVDYSN
jgi:hypothetical protein